MSERLTRHGLQVDRCLADFVENEALSGTGLTADDFWKGFAALVSDLTPANRSLLEQRDQLQAQIDAWHQANPGPVRDAQAYQAFLRQIGYLKPAGDLRDITTENVDPELPCRPARSWSCPCPMRVTR